MFLKENAKKKEKKKTRACIMLSGNVINGDDKEVLIKTRSH